MIRVADYLAQRITALGVKHAFMIVGGGAMHLNDAFGKTPGLAYVANHNEQASAIAAEGYARTIEGGIPGVCVVTSGPGGTNTLTGLIGLWLDSIPGIFVSGQVKTTTTVPFTGLPLRQLGDQELNIVDMVRPVTKYAVMITDPKTVRWHLEKAIHEALTGRPGPVWLDVPLDVQGARIDPDALEGFTPEPPALPDRAQVREWARETLRRIRASERPVIMAGGGIRLAGARDLFRKVVERLNVPVQTAISAIDLIESDHRLFAGRPGVAGDRPSNFIVQNADLLLAIGARLWVRVVSYNFEAFAREAFKISVDVDRAELDKPTIVPDLKVQADCKVFLEELLAELDAELDAETVPPKEPWLAWCRERQRRYPVVLPEMRDQKAYVNSYWFTELLSRELGHDDVIVCGDGTAYTCTFQAFRLKKGQRMFANTGCASMGYDLPAAIGACFAHDKQRVVCITGDGSIQMNLQELQTIVHHRLPIKIFLLNNGGYLAIKITQDTYFPGGYVGCDADSGVSFPDMLKIAEAYGIPAIRVTSHEGLEDAIRTTLESPGPRLCELIMHPNQPLIPKLASEVLPDGKMISKPLEDLYPFLPRDEFLENMIVAPWQPK